VGSGSTHPGVIALRASTGRTVWSLNTGAAVVASPAVVDGVVYIDGEGGNLYALNARTGKQLWSFAAGGALVSSPAVAGGLVYLGGQEQDLRG
jgi:outer membrane protein assembly factor BamB